MYSCGIYHLQLVPLCFPADSICLCSPVRTASTVVPNSNQDNDLETFLAFLPQDCHSPRYHFHHLVPALSPVLPSSLLSHNSLSFSLTSGLTSTSPSSVKNIVLPMWTYPVFSDGTRQTASYKRNNEYKFPVH